MNVKKIFLQNIHTIMQADELNARDFYNLFWYAEKDIDDLERHGILPSVSVIEKIAIYSGCSVYQLFHQPLIRKETESK